MSKTLSRRTLLKRATKVGIPGLILLLLGGIACRLNIIQVVIFLAAAALSRWFSSSSNTSPATAAKEWYELQPPSTPFSQTISRAVVTYHPWYQNFHADPANKCLSEITALGATYVRSDVRWSDVIPDGITPDESAFAWYRAYFQAARDWYGLRPLIVLSSPPAIVKDRYGNNPQMLLKSWNYYIEQVVMHLGDLCEYYQVLNEPNNPVYSIFSQQQNGAAISSAATIIRKQVPQAQIIVNFLMELWGWKEFIEDVLHAAGNSIDIIGLDHYPDTWAFSWQSNWDAVTDLLTEIKSGGHQSIWHNRTLAILETGYATNVAWLRDDSEQVQYFQHFSQALRTFDPSDSPSLALVGFYELCDADSSAFLDPEAHFGLLRSGSLERKPAFSEVSQLCRFLQNSGGNPSFITS